MNTNTGKTNQYSSIKLKHSVNNTFSTVGATQNHTNTMELTPRKTNKSETTARVVKKMYLHLVGAIMLFHSGL